jgi:hypothetical protein
MDDTNGVDYGPLSGLIGVWQGDKGVDIAPEPDGAETNPYFETITYSTAGNVSNAEKQTLAAVHYRQVVQRKSNAEVFHDQTGYWMWDRDAAIVMHSLVIPRGVCVLAGGQHTDEQDEDGRITLNVSAGMGDGDWQIIQSPFMRQNAATREFRQEVICGNGALSYSQTTIVDIYGREFEHTDRNELTSG